MLSRLKHSLSLPFALLAFVMFTLSIVPRCLRAQAWTPAGQMIGPLMWEFPLSLPNGTHLIPLRWVNKRNNDSLYWFDIKSFATTPTMYERQTPGFYQLDDLQDFDSDGLMDMAGTTLSKGGMTLYAACTDRQHVKEVVPGGDGALYGVSNRYFGDIDGDGLNDDFSAEGENAVRIVYGDVIHPLIGPSYVELYDNTREIYPDLPSTKVAVVGMLGGKPCIVQSYQLIPDTAPFYELHELNIDDLRARAPKVRTRLVQKVNVGENRRYGNVVLRTPGVWWLFSSYGTDSGPNGIKVTPTVMSIELVSDYWDGTWQQYFGQGGRRGETNFPRVLEGDRPFVLEEYQTRLIEGIGEVRHTVFTMARLISPESAEVEILGRATPFDSQCVGSALLYASVTPDLDNDGIGDMLVCFSYSVTAPIPRQNSVSLYLTTQRPAVSVVKNEADTSKLVIDQGESWRIIHGAQCVVDPVSSTRVYDLNGAEVAAVMVGINGNDVIVSKPKSLSRQVLWLHLGSCTLRLP